MKLTVPAAELRPFVEACAEIAPGTGKIPALEATKIEAKVDGVAFSATDTYAAVLFRSESFKADSAGTVLLPSANLLRIVKEAAKSDITISWNGSSQKATLAWSGATVKLPVEPEQSFPKIDGFEEPLGWFSLTASALTSAFQRTSFATQSTFTQRALHGINVVVKGISIGFASTDGMRFALVEMDCKNDHDVGVNAIFPPVKLAQLKRLYQNPGDTLDIQVTPSWLRIRGPRGELCWRLLNGQFPDWEGHVPRRAPAEVVVNRKEMIAFVNAHQVVKTSAGKDYKFEFKTDEARLVVSAGIDGDVESKLPMVWPHPQFDVSLDPGFIAEGLSAMTVTDVVFGHDGNKKPVLFREETPDFTYIYSIVPRI